MKKITIIFSTSGAILLPIVVSAQISGLNVVSSAQTMVSSSKPTVSTLINQIVSIGNDVLLLLMGVAIVIFVYSIIKYYVTPGANRAEGGLYVMYSVIGFFVIFSIWGIENILANTFGLGNDRNQPSSVQNIFPWGNSTSNTTQSSNTNFNTSSGNVNTGNTNFNTSSGNVNTGSTNLNTSSGNANTANTNTNTTQSPTQAPQASISADPNDLEQYYQAVNAGVYNSNNYYLTRARAIDLATKNGVPVYNGSTVQYSSPGGVPTSISIDGKAVPVSQSDYTQQELKMINTSKSAASQMGN